VGGASIGGTTGGELKDSAVVSVPEPRAWVVEQVGEVFLPKDHW
jgi:hypothetical protein